MCGIHGFINGKIKAEINTDDFLKSAFVANMLRGTDSSGIAVVSNNGWSDVAKLPVAGMYLPSNKAANSLIIRARTVNTASMCHVRAATVGNITYANTHPFNIVDDTGDEIIGIHNGTLTNWKGKKGASDWDVDSAWAMSHILSENADAFEDFTGAFAFVWWASARPGVLNMARNKERPLFVALTEDGNMVYASEAGMIHWLCDRHRIKLKGSIKELEEGHLFQFDIADPTQYSKSKLPVPKTHTTSSYAGSRNDEGDWGTGGYYGSRGHAYGSAVKTHVEKLDAIFDSIKDEAQPQLALAAPAEKLVTNQERDDAMSMGMLGTKGVFTALGADDSTGHIYGSYESLEVGGETHAVMRDVPEDIDWASGGEWMVKVHGVVDSGNDFIFVVSAPLDEAVPA